MINQADDVPTIGSLNFVIYDMDTDPPFPEEWNGQSFTFQNKHFTYMPIILLSSYIHISISTSIKPKYVLLASLPFRIEAVLGLLS